MRKKPALGPLGKWRELASMQAMTWSCGRRVWALAEGQKQEVLPGHLFWVGFQASSEAA